IWLFFFGLIIILLFFYRNLLTVDFRRNDFRKCGKKGDTSPLKRLRVAVATGRRTRITLYTFP
ncbi:MAG: hypothetical protein LUG98_06185, partial [Tannerellaceae bacterium]|nr:hypothetical protein [Tannerellaceae bacterium]